MNKEKLIICTNNKNEYVLITEYDLNENYIEDNTSKISKLKDGKVYISNRFNKDTEVTEISENAKEYLNKNIEQMSMLLKMNNLLNSF